MILIGQIAGMMMINLKYCLKKRSKKYLSGTKIRNILIEKLNVFTMTVFLVDSVLNNLGVKEFDWILYNYCKSVETLESSQEIINCLKNYKK